MFPAGEDAPLDSTESGVLRRVLRRVRVTGPVARGGAEGAWEGRDGSLDCGPGGRRDPEGSAFPCEPFIFGSGCAPGPAESLRALAAVFIALLRPHRRRAQTAPREGSGAD